MSTPKQYRKTINLNNTRVGDERRADILAEATENTVNLPKGIKLEDIDHDFIRFAKDDLEIIIDGEKVPVIFLTLQRWTEFAKGWQNTDSFGNLKLPFVTVVRNPDVQQGDIQGGFFNIPGRQNWTYLRVPNNRNGRKNVDIYKIPQPTPVDVTYQVRFFSNKIRDINGVHEKIQKIFNSIQAYITPNGHYMPVQLETVGDESVINDVNARRYYVQNFEMLVKGYILDENDFVVTPAVTRLLTMYELATVEKPSFRVKVNKRDRTIKYTIISKVGAKKELEFTSQFDVRYTDFIIIKDINSVTFFVNGTEVTTPFDVRAGDTVKIVMDKDDTLEGKFILNGILI